MGYIPQCPDGVWPLMRYQVTVFDVHLSEGRIHSGEKCLIFQFAL
jgi:hypothetical protein